MARAVSDPELDVDIIDSAMRQKHIADLTGTFDKSSYVFHLACVLAMSTGGKLMQQRTSWAEVFRLAFSYLDMDRDGLLSQDDLMRQFRSDHPEDSSDKEGTTHSDACIAVLGCLEHWQAQQPSNNNNTSTPGLKYLSFCKLLLVC